MRHRLAAVALLFAVSLSPAFPQGLPPELAHGALLIHGNYCGPGNRGYDKAPVDALDAACRRHDLCTPDGGALPSCACNRRLAREAARVASDPRQRADLRELAVVVSNAAQLPICRP